MTDRNAEDGERNGEMEVLIFADEFGVVVQGQPEIAEKAIAQILQGSDPGPKARSTLSVGDTSAVAATGLALGATSGEYLRLTAESAAKVQQFGEQRVDGALRGWVKDGNKFAGQLTFEDVPLAAEQALALQTAAVSLALRSAIADVQKAVEEVGDKVDDIRRHLSARLQGDVVGTYRHLQEVADQTNRRGRLLEADWDSVAGVRHQLHRDLDTLRNYVRAAVVEVTLDLSVPAREKHFRRFTGESGSVADVLRLILVTEQSLQLFEYLRLQRIRDREPEHLGSAVDDARASLRAQQALDQQLVAQMLTTIDRTRVVEPLEVHHVWSAKGLDTRARAFHSQVVDFAEASRTALPEELGEMRRAGLADTREEVRRRAAAVSELGAGVARDGRQRAQLLGERARQRLAARRGTAASDAQGSDEEATPPTD